MKTNKTYDAILLNGAYAVVKWWNCYYEIMQTFTDETEADEYTDMLNKEV